MAYEQIEIAFDRAREQELRLKAQTVRREDPLPATDTASEVKAEEERREEKEDAVPKETQEQTAFAQRATTVLKEITHLLDEAQTMRTDKPTTSAEAARQSVSAAQSTQDTVLPPRDFRRGITPFAINGEINLGYTFERFNAGQEYFEARGDWRHPLQSSALMLGKARHPTREAVFVNKNDGSRITICANKIICDNTDRNIQSALDIAQDKGWQVVKIKGGSRKAKAEMWYQAQMRGLETTGYNPTEADRKRLLGAQERQQAEQAAQAAKDADKLGDALDIKPKSENAQETDKTAAQDKNTLTPDPKASAAAEQVQDKTRDNAPAPDPRASAAAEQVQDKTPAAPAQQTRQNDKEASYTLSKDQQIEYARKHIMAEVEKLAPLDTQQYNDLEAMVDKQLAAVAASGKTLNVDKAKEAIRSGLPVIRHELEAAAQAETRKQKHSRSSRRETETRPAAREPRQASLER